MTVSKLEARSGIQELGRGLCCGPSAGEVNPLLHENFQFALDSHVQAFELMGVEGWRDTETIKLCDFTLAFSFFI